jgi:pilus assembly protein CpaC
MTRKIIVLVIALIWPHVVFAADEASTVRLLVGRSTVVDVGTAITRVSLTSADVADALVTAPDELLVNGKTPGTVSMFVWSRSGNIRRYEVVVQRDLSRLAEQVTNFFPGEQIAVEGNGRNVVLSGTVTNKDVIEKVVSLASGYVDNRNEVVTLLQVQDGAPSNQVLLRVRFAEVSRSAITELGASFFTSPTGVENTIGRVTTQQFSAPGYDGIQYSKNSSDFGSPVVTAEGKFTFSDFLNLFLFNEKYDLGAMIRLLQSKGLFQSLAEPNLVAESGKEASFLAGGEVPIPVAQGTGGNVSISVEYKEFGVRLNFTPTVEGDRVHLKVRPEVSSLDFANGVVLQGFRIPALSTRRTETELELRNGQTFAIAGLINNTMIDTMQKVPGLGDIPILGLLFRSKAAQKNRTELVVMITPEILPNNSPGVTPNEPRIHQPYLPPFPDDETVPSPPPAFGPAPSGSASAQPAPAVPASQAGPATAATAAAAVSALTPAGPRVMTSTPSAAPPASDAVAPVTGQDAVQPLTEDTGAAPPLSEAETERLDQAQTDQQDSQADQQDAPPSDQQGDQQTEPARGEAEGGAPVTFGR